MTYNLLSYRTDFAQCNGSTNNPNTKDAALAAVVQYEYPHILMCQEVGSQPVNADRLLTNALNVNGVSRWEKADYSNNGFSNLVNMLFFDKTVFGLHSQSYVQRDLQNQNLTRVIDFYRLYYKDPLLGQGNPDWADTVYLTVIVAHLKAGSTTADEQERGRATAAVVDYLNAHVNDQYMFIGGDFNARSSNETAVQNLLNNSVSSKRFYDPANALGNWNSSPLFARYHSQSTRNTGNTNNGCFSGGGLDDRFDFIFTSQEVLNNPSAKIKYVNNSYTVLGNDGLHLNKGIKDAPANTSVPSTVLDALHNLSDHLPVSMAIDIQKLGLNTTELMLPVKQLFVANPVRDNLEIRFVGRRSSLLKWRILDVSGRELHKASQQVKAGETGEIEMAFGHKPGLYFLQFEADGVVHTQKLIKL